MSRQRSGLPVRAAGLVGGPAVAGASVFAGAPWWVLLIAAVPPTLAALLPQESEHRRDVYRDLLRHRERMVKLKREAPPDRVPLQRTGDG